MNISTSPMLNNKIYSTNSSSPEELMITSLKEIILLLCDNPNLHFDKEDQKSFDNVLSLLESFYRIFMAQIYITESLPFNILDFYINFFNKHLQSGCNYDHDYHHYNFKHTFRRQFVEFIKEHNEPLTTENT